MVDLMKLEYPYHIYWDEECQCYFANVFGLKTTKLFATTYGETLGKVYAMAGDLTYSLLEHCSVEDLIEWSTTLDVIKQTVGLSLVMIKPRRYCPEHEMFDLDCQELLHGYDISDDLSLEQVENLIENHPR